MSHGLNGLPKPETPNGNSSVAHTTESDSIEPQEPLPQHDLDQIWKWNASIPTQVQGCVHDLIHDIAEKQPEAPAVCAWDGNLIYSELDRMADALAHRLIAAGVTPKSNVPLLFSKSKLTPVAMLGVIKAGCAAIALDATQPDARLRAIVEQAMPAILVCSPTHNDRSKRLTDAPILELKGDETLPSQSTATQSPLHIVSPSDNVYISFTS